MKLHYQVIGEGPPLVILHALLGSSDNWITIAKALQDSFRIYLPDQRNHGESPHADSMSYGGMADDLFQFCEDRDVSGFGLIGHSMGGKTAMEFALRYPERISGLVVVDIAPKTYPPRLHKLLQHLKEMDLSGIRSRRDAEEQLKPTVPQRSVRLFLLKNLERTESGEYRWKINIETLANQYHEVRKKIEQNNRTYDGETLFLKAENSDFIQDQDMDSIKTLFPRARLETIAGADHWVHAEAPEEFSRIVRQFFGS